MFLWKQGVVESGYVNVCFFFFNKCALVNDLLTKNFFLRFYKRRDKFRYLIEKEDFGGNNIIQDLSSSVIEKFNGYETIQKDLKNKEKKIFVQ